MKRTSGTAGAARSRDRLDTLQHVGEPPLQFHGEPVDLFEVQRASCGQLQQRERRARARFGRGSRRTQDAGILPRREHRAIDVDEGLLAAPGRVVNRAGRRLVTRTLGARQQHEVRVGGTAGDRFAQRANRGTVTEQRPFHSTPRVREELLRHRQLARELRVPRLELSTQPLKREVRVDARDHFVALKRLGHEVDRAHLESAHLVLGFVQRRQEDHGSLAGGRVLLQAPARLVAVDAWHHDVEHDQQWLDPARDLDRALAAARHEQPVASTVERMAQDVEIRRVVVDQQDAVGIVNGRRWCCAHNGPLVRFPRRAEMSSWRRSSSRLTVMVAPARSSSARASAGLRRRAGGGPVAVSSG